MCGHVFILCAHLQCEFNEIHVLHVCVCMCMCVCVCVCVSVCVCVCACVICHKAHRFFDGPVREQTGVAQMAEVVDVTKQLIFKLRVLDDCHGAVLGGRETQGRTP